jgi:hypothetical protein
VYYNCVKFHKNSISSLVGSIFTFNMYCFEKYLHGVGSFSVHLVFININLFPTFHYIVLNSIYICVCAIFVDIIICVLFVGRGQSISCDNFLFNPIAVLFAIK